MTLLDAGSMTSDAGEDGGSYTRELKKPGELRMERLQRKEDEHCILALDTVTNHLPVEGLWAAASFEKLPRYRREYVKGYAQGAVDLLAKEAGRSISKKLTPHAVRLPKWLARLQPGAQWRRHSNGGGWVSRSATVSLTAYVGPKCAVYDDARVVEYAELSGHSRACGDAEVYGVAKLGGQAVAGGVARIGGAIHLLGDVQVYDGLLMGEAVIRSQDQVARWTLPDNTPRRGRRGLELLRAIGIEG